MFLLVQASQFTDKILPRLSNPLPLGYYAELCQQAPLSSLGSDLDPSHWPLINYVSLHALMPPSLVPFPWFFSFKSTEILLSKMGSKIMGCF